MLYFSEEFWLLGEKVLRIPNYVLCLLLLIDSNLRLFIHMNITICTLFRLKRYHIKTLLNYQVCCAIAAFYRHTTKQRLWKVTVLKAVDVGNLILIIIIIYVYVYFYTALYGIKLYSVVC